MDFRVIYSRRSELRNRDGRDCLSLTPNLARDPVAFEGELKNPLRFREAISTLHDIVINDLRYKPRDKTAYREWVAERQQQEQQAVRDEFVRLKKEADPRGKLAIPASLKRDYQRCRKRYWQVRQAYNRFLRHHDRALWRRIMPCDPVITVANDSVFFECFSSDESSYGCLSTNREECFGAGHGLKFGTTNVDYSWELFHHFQSLRSYKPTRFEVDPEGFDLEIEGHEDYREEKINLPDGWLRGFLQLQSAMALPMRRVSLSRECLYSVLAYLKRHKARKSPRAVRFELIPGEAPALVLEPWEKKVLSHGTKYEGPSGEPVRIWGRDRLLTLARVLPITERVDVYLLGSGLPSFWVAQLGEMRLTLGLSGWTANDWTRGSNLDLFLPPASPAPELLDSASELLRKHGKRTVEELARPLKESPALLVAAMKQLAHRGQVIYDLDEGAYRWRQVMPVAIGEAQLGPENEELVASRQVKIDRIRRTAGPNETVLIHGRHGKNEIELLLDGDGIVKRGSCGCSHCHRFGIRKGLCRFLLALRDADQAKETKAGDGSTESWYERWRRWSEPS